MEAGDAAAEAVMTAAEYSDQVARWMQQAYHMQVLALGERVAGCLFHQDQEVR